MTDNYSSAVNTAREYYNSEDADNFYAHIWGGEDIHIGMYQSEDQSIAEASRLTVEHMASHLTGVDANAKVLDIGAGYGGSARYLASRFGCSVVALNLSEKENERDRELNKQQGLDDKIDVVDASFEEIPFDDAHFDVVWSQDAILHSGNREQVIREVARVLKPGGQFIFTDPMQADDCPEGVLQPIFDRIHLSSLGSPAFYRAETAKHGMQEIVFDDQTQQLVNHYSTVLRETSSREHELTQHVSPEYIERMKKGLGHWIDGGKNGYLTWGVFVFKKD
ncbi:MAG: methyltransferase domain-containing protein [Gammaproteobacteria bacterium]|nr:methyltransferase domain-containing protein [Gammaproteobacteria bacterium]